MFIYHTHCVIVENVTLYDNTVKAAKTSRDLSPTPKTRLNAAYYLWPQVRSSSDMNFIRHHNKYMATMFTRDSDSGIGPMLF